MSKLTEIPEASMVFILKQIVMAVEHTMEQGYTVKLDLRLGQLRFANGLFSFSTAPKANNRADTASQATSCNTEY